MFPLTPQDAITRRSLLTGATALTLLHRIAQALPLNTHEQTSLNHTLKGTPASATVLQALPGRTLATYGNMNAIDTPGSTLKPLLLDAALRRNLITPETTVFCRRDLRIANQPYPCTHPQSNIAFTAQDALAYSCNTWFAALALRFTPAQLDDALRQYHLHPTAFTSPEQKQLLTLGLSGITTTPAQLAVAYRILATQFTPPVSAGLRNSVTFGMAHNADVPGLTVFGKTGTASNPPRQPWSHGWFVGIATIRTTPLVLSIYLPQGNGADAANLAKTFFLALSKATA